MLGLTDELYEKFINLIQDRIGVTYNRDQKNTLNNRLMPLLISYKISDFNEFYSILKVAKDGQFLSDFIGRVTTNHTYFYREHSHFELLKAAILPRMAKKITETQKKNLKIWVAASSTGEEAYTVAMVVHAYFFSKGLKNAFSVLATDISRKAIESGQRGIYKNSEIIKLPLNLQQAYLKRVDEHHCEVLTLIRDLITFRVLNLVRDNFPFKGRFDIIFLRNVLIYFEDKVKVQLLNQLNELMVDGGVLFIGQTESFPQSISSLQTIYPSVFCKGELG